MINRLQIISIAMLVMFTGNAYSTSTTFTPYSGNDNNNAEFLGVLDNLGYEFWAKNDVGEGLTGNKFTFNIGNGRSGSWDTNGVDIVGFTYKAGNDFVFVDYGIGHERTFDNWCTDGGCEIGDGKTSPISITNKNGKAKDLSHISLYTVSAVPEASTYALMLSGLGIVGMMVRRRKKLDVAA